MNGQWWCAILGALALAAPVEAQNEPSLELAPLVPPKAPWLKKNQKKKRVKKAPPAPADVQPGAPFVAAPPSTAPALPQPPPPAPPKPVETQLPLPPLVPLAPPPPSIAVANVGVVVQSDGLDAASAATVEQGLRGVVKIAPLTRIGPVLAKTAQPCATDGAVAAEHPGDSCLAAQAALQSIDQLLVANYAKGALSVRLLDVARKRTMSEAKEDAVGAGEAAASAEALACKLLVPAGCLGEVAADASDGVQLELDGKPLARGEKRKVAVGVHQLSARAAGKVAQRSLPVSREGAPSLHAQVVDGQPRILSASELVPQAAVATEAPPAPAFASKNRWSKPVGFAAIGIGAAALAAGAIVGAMSHSDINAAETAYRANGGAYRTGDLNTLASGNSKAHSANALFAASGVLLAAGAVFTLAF